MGGGGEGRRWERGGGGRGEEEDYIPGNNSIRCDFEGVF